MSSLVLSGREAKRVFITQKPIDYIDTTLTVNTFEEVSASLSSGKPAKLWWIIIEQTNNATSAEDISLEVTINGTAYTFTQANAASGTRYYCQINENLDTGDYAVGMGSSARTVGGSVAGNYAISFTAKSVGLIRAKQTTTVDGTSAQIEVNIVWEKQVEV